MPAIARLLCLATVGLLAGCYAETANECYYHYGYVYGYPLCEMPSFQSWHPGNGYEPLYVRSFDSARTVSHPDPARGELQPVRELSVEHLLYIGRQQDIGDPSPADELNQQYPCGASAGGAQAVCWNNGTRIRNTEHLVVVILLREPVPMQSEADRYSVGFFFDRDDIESNNDTPAPFGVESDDTNAHDEGADKAFVATYEPSAGWQLDSRLFEGGAWVSNSPTEARIIIEDRVVVVLVPASEFDDTFPGVRVALFREALARSSAGDWSADLVPPLDEPLAGF